MRNPRFNHTHDSFNRRPALTTQERPVIPTFNVNGPHCRRPRSPRGRDTPKVSPTGTKIDAAIFAARPA